MGVNHNDSMTILSCISCSYVLSYPHRRNTLLSIKPAYSTAIANKMVCLVLTPSNQYTSFGLRYYTIADIWMRTIGPQLQLEEHEYNKAISKSHNSTLITGTEPTMPKSKLPQGRLACTLLMLGFTTLVEELAHPPPLYAVFLVLLHNTTGKEHKG